MKTIDLDAPPAEVQSLLEKQGWLEPGETVTATNLAGQGNMNVVLRLQTNHRTLILKQSRPFVQKYPDIPAPLGRISVEHAFYHAVSSGNIAERLPRIYGFDSNNYLLLMQDLGQSEDMTSLYASRWLPGNQLETLVQTLTGIHRTPPPPGYPENLELRQLNHQHIFVLPFTENNGFNLDQLQPGLEALAARFKTDAALLKRVTDLGQRYLQPGGTLLHGDYYPGSWLEVDEQVYVIDPEFSFAGFAEFDLGVMAAHLFMATMDPEIVPLCFAKYSLPMDRPTACQIAGTEVVRRLIGLAQLPLERTLAEKESLLNTAYQWIME